MRVIFFLSFLLSGLGMAWAQSPSTPERSPTPALTGAGAVEKRTEFIQIEDASARIAEVRVGGETKSISVQPKGGMPGYDVQPTSGARSWKILDF